MAKQMLKQKKKKKWYPLYAPQIFNNQLIGESYVENPDQMQGKYVHANLSTIINDMKKQNTAITLRVNRVADGKAYTEVIGMKLLQSFVKRLVRRGRTKIDDSFLVRSKEGVVIRVKPLVVTRSNCLNSTARQIRAATKAAITEYVQSQPFSQSVQNALLGRFQKELKEKLNKMYPIRSVDIRVLQREVIKGRLQEIKGEEVAESKEEKEAPKTTEENPVEPTNSKEQKE